MAGSSTANATGCIAWRSIQRATFTRAISSGNARRNLCGRIESGPHGPLDYFGSGFVRAVACSLPRMAGGGRRGGALPHHFRPKSQQKRNAAIPQPLNMKKEYDFSKAERGKFYRAGAKLN